MEKPKVSYDFSNRIISLLLGNVRTRLLSLIRFSKDQKPIVADLGCGSGNLAQVLCEYAQSTIALDVDKNSLLMAKELAKKADLILADITHLPLRSNSLDVAVVASVFEFIEELESAIKETKDAIKRGGIQIAGYPIQTKFVKVAVEMIDKRAVRTWDPTRIMTANQCRKEFLTHKQKYLTIRRLLKKNFLMLEMEKMPFRYLPDSISIYEFIKMLKID